jgi:hypothetical protein
MATALHTTVCFNFHILEVVGLLFSSNLINNGETELFLCLIVTSRLRIVCFSVDRNLFIYLDRLCDLVVRVPGYRSRGPGFDSRRYQIF